MSVLYIFVGLISVAAVVFVLIGIGSITKYLLRTYKAEDSRLYSGADDEVPSFLLGAFVLAVLSIVISLIVVVLYYVGQALVNALA